MPKLWFMSGFAATAKPMLDIPPDMPGLKDWFEQHVGLRPGWPDAIRTDYSADGSIDLEVKLNFRLRIVDEVEALTLVAKAELSK